MSVTQFLVRFWLYSDDYIDSQEYAQLKMDYPQGLTPQHAYRMLCCEGQYKLEISRATSLSRMLYRYIYAVLNTSVTVVVIVLESSTARSFYTCIR